MLKTNVHGYYKDYYIWVQLLFELTNKVIYYLMYEIILIAILCVCWCKRSLKNKNQYSGKYESVQYYLITTIFDTGYKNINIFCSKI